MEKLENEKKIVKTSCIEETDFGINSNPTGYGKTLEMVALILRDKMQWDLEEQHKEIRYSVYSGGRLVRKHIYSYDRLHPTLIVTNQSIIKQWLKEFSYTDLDVVSVMTKKDAMEIDPDCYDVVIVTCTMFNKLGTRFSEYAWKRFVFDEPGHVKIPSMKRIRAGFTWLITATPYLIHSLHKQCRSSMICELLDGVGYGFGNFEDIIIKNDQEFIEQSFNMPQTNHEYYYCYDPMFKTVKGLVNDKIADMISAGNILEAVRSLGGKDTDNVIDLVKKGKQEEIQVTKQTIDVYKSQGRDDLIGRYEEKVERIEQQIEELEKRFETLLTGDCPICCSQLFDPIMEPRCQNIFCGSCLFTWLNSHKSCPMCRQDVDSNTLVYIKDKSDNSNNDTEDECTESENNGPTTKQQQIENILDDNPDGKFIIFSHYDGTFNVIRNFLRDKDVTFAEIKGSVAERDRNIKQFKNGDIKVLFLNSKNNGSGINLQEATDIILFHEMNDDMLKQVIGRANRIGRTESLNVHHLISA